MKLIDKLKELVKAPNLQLQSDKEVAELFTSYLSSYINESASNTKMNIFDPKNKKHILILREELSRAKHLIESYNEEEIWNAMSDPERSQALLSADDDMGPDFADEFTDTPWLDIPDVITNRIDLRTYAKPEKEKLSRQDFLSKDRDMRGMSYQSKENDAYKRFIEAYLKKQNIQIDYNQSRPLYKALNQLSKDQVRDLFFKAHEFRASLSKFVPPTPEQEEESARNMANIINQDRIDNPGFSRD